MEHNCALGVETEWDKGCPAFRTASNKSWAWRPGNEATQIVLTGVKSWKQLYHGKSVKMTSGHNPHKTFKIHKKAHMLELGYFEHQTLHCLGSLQDTQHRHAGHTRLYIS